MQVLGMTYVEYTCLGIQLVQLLGSNWAWTAAYALLWPPHKWMGVTYCLCQCISYWGVKIHGGFLGSHGFRKRVTNQNIQSLLELGWMCCVCIRCQCCCRVTGHRKYLFMSKQWWLEPHGCQNFFFFHLSLFPELICLFLLCSSVCSSKWTLLDFTCEMYFRCII